MEKTESNGSKRVEGLKTQMPKKLKTKSGGAPNSYGGATGKKKGTQSPENKLWSSTGQGVKRGAMLKEKGRRPKRTGQKYTQ